MKILIADDHLVVRKGLIQIVNYEFPEAVFDEVSNGSDALAKLRTEQYAIAILDITMPDLTGLDVLRQIKSEEIKTPVLILTSHPEDQYAIRVIKAGASGFIGKEEAGEELTNAIRKILKGKMYITESLADILVNEIASNIAKQPHELLSDREFEVFKLIANGKTVSEIAAQLSISVPSVSTYRTRILDKMKLKNNAEMMHYAISRSIVT